MDETIGIDRSHAIAAACAYFDAGLLLDRLRSRIAFETESQAADNLPRLEAYLREAIVDDIEKLGFSCRVVPNPVPGGGPFLLAARIEDESLPTVLIYGHGDTTLGNPQLWRDGLAPFELVVVDDRWYGRGTADNKGQHSVNLAAIAVLLEIKGGRLGLNVKLIIEMGEETGSPGLRQLCSDYRSELAADVFISSDGPRISAERPTLFLGARGVINFDLTVKLRDKSYHSGNWGGLLRNPGTVLASAIAAIVDAQGRILVPALRPPPLSPRLRELLSDLTVGGGAHDPEIDDGWGEPGLTASERLYGWNTIEILTFKTGEPDRPQNAIPSIATARMQLRFVVGTRIETCVDALRAHLDQAGFSMVAIENAKSDVMAATRLDPDDRWVRWAEGSIYRTTRKRAAIVPNLGGSLPNEIFAIQLALPTLWVPHSYPACGQHGPDEHMLGSIAREGMAMMTGLLWDLGEDGPAMIDRKQAACARAL